MISTSDCMAEVAANAELTVEVSAEPVCCCTQIDRMPIPAVRTLGRAGLRHVVILLHAVWLAVHRQHANFLHGLQIVYRRSMYCI